MGFFTPDIKRLQKDNNISALLKCLEHKRASVRYRAFAALAGINDPDGEIAERLRNMMYDADPEVKSLAVVEFATSGGVPLSDDLVAAIRNGPRKAQIEILKIIAGHGHSDDIYIMQVIMDALADKNKMVKKYAITAAGATGNGNLVPYLAECLHDKHHDVRLQSAKALNDIGGNDSIDCLIGLLADHDARVRAAARSYLENVENEIAQKALHDSLFMQLVSGMNGTEPERRRTARKIGRDAVREGLPLLHRACRDRYKGVRIEALKAIAVFENPSSVDFISRLVHDKYHDVRLEAVRTLEHFIDARALKAIEDALHDGNEQVREAAQKAYDRIEETL